MKVGIEMEFWVVDESGRLCDGRRLGDAHDLACPEFVGPLVEVETAPHEHASDLRRDLAGTLRAVLDAAATAGLQLVPLGTPLTETNAEAATPRGRLFERIYGEGIRGAKNCAGTHVHFDQHGDDAAVTRQLTLLTALDPALALVSSAPYYCGERTADSARAAAYRSDCGERLARFSDLWPYVEDRGAWDERVAAASEAFHELADERGVDAARVRSWFDPEDIVLNPVRLRESPATVEWRAPDTTLPSDAIRLAFDVAALVEETRTKPVETVDDGYGVDEDRIRVPEQAALDDLSRAGIRQGLGSEAVRSYLDAMGFDRGRYAPISRRIRGAPTIDADGARAVRSWYAERLRRHVHRLAADTPASSSGSPPRPAERP